MNIAITGASGHIGHCLCKALIKRGDKVKVLLRRYDPSFANSNIECIRGNILKPETLSDLCQNTDVLIHLAAQISIDNKQANGTHQTNVIGTQNILKASLKAGVKKFIHFSSINAFSLVDKGQILQEDIALTDSKNDIYAYSKAESEREVMKAIKKGLNAVILCPTGVFGPDDFRHSFLGRPLKAFT